MDVSEYRTRILTPKDRAILLNAAVKGKITKPLSISKMRREILAAMGVKDNRATGYYNSSSSFNRSEIMTIHSFLTSRFRNGIEVKKEKV